MAEPSVLDFILFINQQVDTHEEINAKLSQIKAMGYVLQKANIDECPEYIVHCYMGILEDLVESASKLNDWCIKELMGNKYAKAG